MTGLKLAQFQVCIVQALLKQVVCAQDPAKCEIAARALTLLHEYLTLSASASLPSLMFQSCGAYLERILVGLDRESGRDKSGTSYFAGVHSWETPVIKLVRSVIVLYSLLLERCEVSRALTTGRCWQCICDIDLTFPRRSPAVCFVYERLQASKLMVKMSGSKWQEHSFLLYSVLYLWNRIVFRYFLCMFNSSRRRVPITLLGLIALSIFVVTPLTFVGILICKRPVSIESQI